MSASSIKDHQVQGIIARIVELQGSPEFAEPMVVENEQYLFARDKVFAMAHVMQSLLQSTPAELTSAPGLSNLTAHLQSPLGELNSFIANKNPQHIVNAASQFEQNILPIAWSFGPQLQNLPPDSLSRLFEAQARASDQAIKQLTVQRDTLAASLQELTNRVNEQSLRVEGLQEGSARERAEAAATVAKLEQQFAEKETERASAFSERLKELGDAFTDYDAQRRVDAQALMTDLERQRTEAARIVGVVGNTGITGNYQKIAMSEAQQADSWRGITIGFFGVGVILAIVTFVTFLEHSADPFSVVIRLLFALGITAPAWYTARESARHRTNADRARQTELELASLGPFIELLPEAKKDEIRAKMTDLYFGKGVETHTVSDPTDSVKALGGIVVDMMKAAKNL